MENGEVPLEDTEDFFLHKAGLTVIPICAKKKQQQHLGHFPQKKPQKNKQNMPSTIHVSDREEKSYNTV